VRSKAEKLPPQLFEILPHAVPTFCQYNVEGARARPSTMTAQFQDVCRARVTGNRRKRAALKTKMY